MANLHLAMNLKAKHVLKSNVFPILFRCFVGIPGAVTRAVIGSSIPHKQRVFSLTIRMPDELP